MQRALSALCLSLLLVSCGSNSTSNSGMSTTSARDLLGFTSSQLGSAYVGDSYSGTIAAIGGTAPYSVRLVGGKLPDGLKFTGGSSASIAGTPTVAGSSSFRLEVIDANLSVRSQDFNITVAELPPLDFDMALPTGEVRGETRVPVRILGARNVRAARYIWKLPDNVQVVGVEGDSSTQAGRPVLFWKQLGQTFTLDVGFRITPKNGAQIAMLRLKPAGDLPFTLTKPVSGTSSFVTALDGSGKSIREVKTPEALAAEKALNDQKQATNQGTGTPSTGTQGTGTPSTATPSTTTPTSGAATPSVTAPNTATPATGTPATTTPTTPAPATPAAPGQPTQTQPQTTQPTQPQKPPTTPAPATPTPSVPNGK